MLKEFIEHIQKTTQPLITTVNGSTFRITDDGNVKEILPTIFHPDTLDLNSLDALVTMVRTEASEMDAPLYIAVPDCKSAASGRSIMKHTPQTFPVGRQRPPSVLRKPRSHSAPASRKRRIRSMP